MMAIETCRFQAIQSLEGREVFYSCFSVVHSQFLGFMTEMPVIILQFSTSLIKCRKKIIIHIFKTLFTVIFT